jgi:hypothetical protein
VKAMTKQIILSLGVMLISATALFAKPEAAAVPQHVYAYHNKGAIKYDKQRINYDNKNVRAERKAIRKHTKIRDRKLEHGNMRGAAKQQHHINQHKKVLQHEKHERRADMHHVKKHMYQHKQHR